MSTSHWIVIPAVGALIGYLTNRLAVKMIFRPVRPVRLLGLTLQGLIGRRQAELAESIGRVVGDHLVRHEDIVAALSELDVHGLVDRAVERGLARKLEDLRRMRFLRVLLSEERVADLRRQFVQALLKDQQGLVEEFERAVEQGLDVSALVERKIAAFPVERVERLVFDVASRELRAIEVLGGVLGAVIGLVQVALLQLV